MRLLQEQTTYIAQLLGTYTHICTPLHLCTPNVAGQEEVESCVRLLEEEARKLRRSNLKMRLLPVPLYAGLPATHQLGVFEAPPRGYRKASFV